MEKAVCILLGVLCLPLFLCAQMITGKVLTTTTTPAPGANILLLTSSDSTQLAATTADEQGIFTFSSIGRGTYILSLSSVGYSKFYYSFNINENTTVLEIPPIMLTTENALLKSVEVTGKKPFIEQRIDRMIVNVSGSIISSSGTALEILQKTPGVTVDQQNDLLQLRGKEGVMIQIDGKQTYLPADQVVAMLRNMPGSNIERIEIITNPSAKYNAEGNAGIIDIRLKKNNNKGTNGSISLSAGSGKYDRQRGAFQINNKSSRLNIFANYGLNRGGDFWDFQFQRILQDGADKNYVHQRSPVYMRNEGHTAKAGIDWEISRSTTLGIFWTGAWNKRKENSVAETGFRHQADGPVYLFTHTDKDISNITSNQLGSINLQHILSNKGQITANIDMGRYTRNFYNSLSTVTVIAADTAQPVRDLISIMPVEIDIFTTGADYSRTYDKGWNFQAGWKSSVVRSSNNMELRQGEKGDLQYDSALSNNFIYKATIHAAYINLSGHIDTLTEVQAGLRVEQTISDANSISQTKRVKRHYLNMFPSFFVRRKISGKQTLAFSYGYRINRPNYQNLNPVRSYLDPYAYFRGNAFLQPDYTHSFEIKHGYNNAIYTSLGARFTKDVIFFILQPVDSKTSERTPANIGKENGYDLTVTAPVNIMKGWTLQWTAIGTYGVFRVNYLDSFFKAQQFSGKLNITNMFVFGKGWTGECSGWVNTPEIESIWRRPWLASMDIGVQKVYRSWKFKFSFSDLFHSDIVKAKINTPQFSNDVKIKFDTRIALLGVVYSFGNQQLRSRQRRSGSEDELKRLNQ